MSGVLHILGMGPGDPELVTLKAARVLGRVVDVAHFAKAGRPGHAWSIARHYLGSDVGEWRFDYPFTVERPRQDPSYDTDMAAFYDDCAERLAGVLVERDAVLLCEGDPFFYGSAMYLYDRLRARFETRIVPGITAMGGAWCAAALPITDRHDVLSVIPGTMSQAALTERLRGCEAAVVMKLGRHLPAVKQALADAGRLEDAVYVERATQDGEVIRRLVEIEGSVPYFSLILVPGRK